MIVEKEERRWTKRLLGGWGGGGERRDKVEENKGGSNEKGNVDTRRSKESRAFSSCSVWTEYIFSLKGLYS